MLCLIKKKMKVVIQTLDRVTVNIDINDDSSLMDLKVKIADIKNHPFDQMSIIYLGKKLEDNNKKLSEYSINDDTRLILVMHKNKPVEVKQVEVEPPKVIEQSQPEQVSDEVFTPTEEENESMFPTTIGQLLQQNPQALMGLLMSNPQFAQLSQQYPNELQQIINDPSFLNSPIQIEGIEDEEEDPMYEKVFTGQLQLTDIQKKDVEDLISSGFGTYEDIIQMYVAMDYNKDATANALLDEKFND
jgi:hypothetical protein